MKDAQLNPSTADYTGYTSDSLANAVYIRLFTPLGSWWADPKLGSRLHELQRNKDVARIHVLARQYCKEALQPLIDEKRAISVLVNTVSPDKDHTLAGRMLLHIEVMDAQGNVHQFRHNVKVS